MRLGIGVNAHKVQELVVVARVDNDTPVRVEPYAEGVLLVDQGGGDRILQSRCARDEEAKCRLARAQQLLFVASDEPPDLGLDRMNASQYGD